MYEEYEDIVTEVIEGGQLVRQEHSFVIDNDKKADWAVRKIKEVQEERDRLLSLVTERFDELKAQEDDINSRYERDTEYLMQQLSHYMQTVKTKQTKTQETYQLLSGKLVHKYGSIDFKRDDKQVIEWCKNSDHGKLIKVKEDLDWAELKKLVLVVDGNVIISDSGEIIPGITVDKKPDKFDIKF